MTKRVFGATDDAKEVLALLGKFERM
ncbi:MAG: hypothetical protein QOJ84_2599, partial [Bradyrhizobium sp.]|nr:hypothetical protein [Bradyrhizobium sp.]